MLTIFRRHKKQCAHRSEGRKYRRCKCPLWVDGFLGGEELRKSLGHADWEKAQDTVRGWEAEGVALIAADEPMTIEKAKTDFLADAEARKLKFSSVYRYTMLFRQLAQFTQAEGIRYLKELDTATLRRFRSSWKDGDLAGLKKLDRLRSFFRFVQENGWLTENPARALKNPKVTLRPTLPFSQDEMVRISPLRPRKSQRRAPTVVAKQGVSGLLSYCFATPACASAMLSAVRPTGSTAARFGCTHKKQGSMSIVLSRNS
jgi:hypothetical protein